MRFSLFYILAFVQVATFAQQYMLDEDFAMGSTIEGINLSPVGSGSFSVSDMAIEGDGAIFIAGGSTITNNVVDFRVHKYLPSGILDNSFSDDGVFLLDFEKKTDQVRCIALTSDGNLLLAGDVGIDNGIKAAVVKIYNQGIIDQSFAKDGKFTSNLGRKVITPFAMDVDAFGSIYIGGRISASTGSNDEIFIFKLSEDGVLDPTFNTTGFKIIDIPSYFSEEISNLKVLSDGSIFFVGHASKSADSDVFYGRYNSDGSPFQAFGSNGIIVLSDSNRKDITRGISVTKSSQILIAATSTSLTNNQDKKPLIIKFNIDGTLDSSFGNEGKLLLDTDILLVRDICILKDDGICIVGSVTINGTTGWKFITLDQKGNFSDSDVYALSGSPFLGSESCLSDKEGNLFIGGRVDGGWALAKYVGKISAIKNQEIDQIEIFPNPSDGHLTIKSKYFDLTNAIIHIHSIGGELVHSSQPIDNNLNFTLPAGLYIVSIANELSILRKKIIINNF
jgi:uncharacterized delta-60 repeat protein